MNTEQSTTAGMLRIATVVLASMIVAWVCTQPQAENDFWLLARIGAWTFEHQSIPQQLVFPFTEAQYFHYNAHEWLAALFLHALDRLFTQDSLALVSGGLGLALFAAVTYMAYVRSNKRLSTALALGVLAMLAENYRHFLRPELITLFYLIALLILLEKLTQAISLYKLLLLFLLVTLWANTHGSFVLALPLSFVFALDRIHHTTISNITGRHWVTSCAADGLRWLILPLAVLIGSLCTPFGTKLWVFSLGFTHHSVAKTEITEWMSPFDGRSLSIVGMYPGLVLSLVLLILLAWKRNHLPLRVIGTGLIFVYLASLGNRFMVYQGIIFAWIAPAIWHEKNRISHWPEQTRLALLGLFLLLLLPLCIRYGNMNGAYPFDARSNTLFSRGIVATLAELPDGSNVFNSYDLGGELIYRGFPRLRPSIDSRIDSYGDSYYFWHEALLDNSSNFQKFLTQWNVKYLLLTHTDFFRLNALSHSPAQMCTLLVTDMRIYLVRCIQSTNDS